MQGGIVRKMGIATDLVICCIQGSANGERQANVWDEALHYVGILEGNERLYLDSRNLFHADVSPSKITEYNAFISGVKEVVRGWGEVESEIGAVGGYMTQYKMKREREKS